MIYSQSSLTIDEQDNPKGYYTLSKIKRICDYFKIPFDKDEILNNYTSIVAYDTKYFNENTISDWLVKHNISYEATPNGIREKYPYCAVDVIIEYGTSHLSIEDQIILFNYIKKTNTCKDYCPLFDSLKLCFDKEHKDKYLKYLRDLSFKLDLSLIKTNLI